MLVPLFTLRRFVLFIGSEVFKKIGHRNQKNPQCDNVNKLGVRIKKTGQHYGKYDSQNRADHENVKTIQRITSSYCNYSKIKKLTDRQLNSEASGIRMFHSAFRFSYQNLAEKYTKKPAACSRNMVTIRMEGK